MKDLATRSFLTHYDSSDPLYTLVAATRSDYFHYIQYLTSSTRSSQPNRVVQAVQYFSHFLLGAPLCICATHIS